MSSNFDPRIPVKQEFVMSEIMREFEKLRAENVQLRTDRENLAHERDQLQGAVERLRAVLAGRAPYCPLHGEH